MKIILLQDIKKIGKKNTVVDVKDGYATFLLNSNKAVKVSSKSLEILNKQIAHQKQVEDQLILEANKLKEKIESLTLNFTLKTNNTSIFGSISNKQIIDKLFSDYGIKLDKFCLPSGKTYSLGQSRIIINLHKKINATLLINVTKEQ